MEGFNEVNNINKKIEESKMHFFQLFLSGFLYNLL